jgi:hypothetical protein
MPYEISSENRTLSDPNGDPILTAAYDSDMPTLAKIAAAANGSPSGATDLIFAPDVSSFIGVDGEVSVMLSGVEDKALGFNLVLQANLAGQDLCAVTSVGAESLGGWAGPEDSYSWTYSIDQGATWNNALYQGNDFSGAIDQLTSNLGFTPWTWDSLTGVITGMTADHPLANGPAQTIWINTDVEVSNNLGSVFFPTLGGSQNYVSVHSCGSFFAL